MTAKTLVLVLTLAAVVLGGAAADAITIYPIDRAQILAGSRFDFKVEFDGIIAAADTKVTINGADLPATLGRSATFVEQEDGVSEVLIVSLNDLTGKTLYSVDLQPA